MIVSVHVSYTQSGTDQMCKGETPQPCVRVYLYFKPAYC